jgi:hypothetical protein
MSGSHGRAVRGYARTRSCTQAGLHARARVLVGTRLMSAVERLSRPCPNASLVPEPLMSRSHDLVLTPAWSQSH